MGQKNGGGPLMLTRRVNESIWIGDDIQVTVQRIRGGQVRLAFHAPKDVPIHREEIYQRIQKEKAGVIS